MVEWSWMIGDDEVEGSSKVFKKTSKSKGIQMWDQLVLWGRNQTHPPPQRVWNVVCPSIPFSMPTHVGKERFLRPHDHSLREERQW